MDIENIIKQIPDKSEDKNTTSHTFKRDLINFIGEVNEDILEIGSAHGKSTFILSKMFKHVYAVDHNKQNHKTSKLFNTGSTNITYITKNIYAKNAWADLPKSKYVFIDCVHEYDKVFSDIKNAKSHGCQIFIFDDYGLSPGVKKCVDEFIENGHLKMVKKIGLPPGSFLKNTHYKNFKDYEGIICEL